MKDQLQVIQALRAMFRGEGVVVESYGADEVRCLLDDGSYILVRDSQALDTLWTLEYWTADGEDPFLVDDACTRLEILQAVKNILPQKKRREKDERDRSEAKFVEACMRKHPHSVRWTLDMIIHVVQNSDGPFLTSASIEDIVRRSRQIELIEYFTISDPS